MSGPPAAERNSWPRPASREPAPAPLVAAESARENHAAAPPPAEIATEPPAATAAAGDAVAQAEPAAEQTGRQGRKAARGRRSSVPSWDEIMFGSSRQRDLRRAVPAIGHVLQAIWAPTDSRPDSAKTLSVCRRGHGRERSRQRGASRGVQKASLARDGGVPLLRERGFELVES